MGLTARVICGKVEIRVSSGVLEELGTKGTSSVSAHILLMIYT